MKRDWRETAAASVSAVLMAGFAASMRKRALGETLGMPLQDMGWDSRILAKAGELQAQGADPYAGPLVFTPAPLPFVSPPQAAEILGVMARLSPTLVFYGLIAFYVAGLVGSWIILSRLAMGRTASSHILGLGLLIGGLGGFFLQVVVAANIGVALYFAIFAGLAYALASRRWLWFHVAVALAVQVKPPFAAFWIVPVLIDGWSWNRLREAAIAAGIAALPFAAEAILAPERFAGWLNALRTQLTEDVGYGLVGAAEDTKLFVGAAALLPLAAHFAIAAGLALLLLFDRKRGPMRATALVLLAMFVNPRLKEYDLMIAAVAAGGLFVAAWSAGRTNRGMAMLATTGVMAFLLVARRWGAFADLAIAAAMAGAILLYAVGKTSVEEPSSA